jgi:hypothetical protein
MTPGFDASRRPTGTSSQGTNYSDGSFEPAPMADSTPTKKIKAKIRGGMGAGRGDNANAQGY